MKKRFVLDNFFKRLDFDVFNKYLKYIGLDQFECENENPSLKEKVDILNDCFQKISPEYQSRIVSDFSKVYEISDQRGLLEVLDVFKLGKKDISSDIAEVTDIQNQLLVALMVDQSLFHRAFVFYESTEMKKKAHRTGLKIEKPENIKKRLNDFERALKNLLRAEGRGAFCHIETYIFDHLMCLIAYPSDYLKTFDVYVKDSMEKQSLREGIQIMFAYEFEKGELSLDSGRLRSKEEDLIDLFNKIVLQSGEPVQHKKLIFKLDKLIDKDFKFDVSLNDQIEDVLLKGLTVQYKNPWRRLTFEAEQGKGADAILKLLEKHNVKLSDVEVTEAKLFVQLKSADRRKGRATFVMKSSNHWTLSDSKKSEAIGAALERWGLKD